MTTPDWLCELVCVDEILAETDRAELARWRGVDEAPESNDPDVDENDVPPLTVRLGYLARAFADRCFELSPKHRAMVLHILENVQESGSEIEGSAVATGFFEALLNRWDKGFDLRLVWGDMGAKSRAYCRAWNDFTGIESPDWMR